jgi:hypothetical protein
VSDPLTRGDDDEPDDQRTQDDRCHRVQDLRLQAVLAMTQPGGDDDLTSDDIEALEVLLSATDEWVYMLTDADTNDELRYATIAELCESLLSGPQGFIKVDGKECYVEKAMPY